MKDISTVPITFLCERTLNRTEEDRLKTCAGGVPYFLDYFPGVEYFPALAF